jgi:polyisoprenoid-binding protein YceI
MKRLFALLLLAACSAGTPPPAPEPADAKAWYTRAAAAGTEVYAVAPGESLVAITVRRAGLLERLGHDHVVASRSINGFAAPAAGRVDISFRADQLTVDEPALRHEAGLTTEPSAQAIEGTRTNMLTKVLDAQRYPLISVHAQLRKEGGFDAAITLHGITRHVVLPAQIEHGPDAVSASGKLLLSQTEFGITPMSVAGGLLAVQDELELRWRIVARRWRGSLQR